MFYARMERIDPATAAQLGSLPDWASDIGLPSDPTQGFGEHPIGELVRAIVTRLDQQASCAVG